MSQRNSFLNRALGAMGMGRQQSDSDARRAMESHRVLSTNPGNATGAELDRIRERMRPAPGPRTNAQANEQLRANMQAQMRQAIRRAQAARGSGQLTDAEIAAIRRRYE